MKTILLLVIGILICGVVHAADQCNTMNLCYNQNGNPFCSATDSECVFKTFEYKDGCKISSIEIDSDKDGWSDSCDAFLSDPGEWVDYDADGVGHNSDLDDLNASVGVLENNTDKKTTEDTTEEVSTHHEKHKVSIDSISGGIQYQEKTDVNLSENITKVIIQTAAVPDENESNHTKEIIKQEDPIVNESNKTGLLGTGIKDPVQNKRFPYYIFLLLAAAIWWSIKSVDYQKTSNAKN